MIIADENLDAKIIAALRAINIDVYSIAERHSGFSDEEVITLAKEILDLLLARRLFVFSRGQFAAIYDIHGTFGSHHRNLGGRVGEVHIRPQVLRSHHAISAAIGLARDDGDFRDGCLGIGIQ